MLKSNNYDYVQTTQKFMTNHGVNPIPLRQSSSAKKGRFPVKKESYAFCQQSENKELIERISGFKEVLTSNRKDWTLIGACDLI